MELMKSTTRTKTTGQADAIGTDDNAVKAEWMVKRGENKRPRHIVIYNNKRKKKKQKKLTILWRTVCGTCFASACFVYTPNRIAIDPGFVQKCVLLLLKSYVYASIVYFEFVLFVFFSLHTF